MPNVITITFSISGFEAEAMAQFLKRTGLGDYREHTTNNEHAYQAQRGCYELKKALADAGYDPR